MPRAANAQVLIALLIAACAPACAGASRPRLARDLPVQRSFGASVEAQDPALSRALLALRLAPSAAQHKAVAAEYRRLRIDDAAFDHLTAALRLDPDDAAAYDARARIWRDWGFPQLGMADTAKAIYFAPESAAARNTRGTLLAAIGQIEAARREFRQALALDPGAAFASRNLCLLDAAERSPETCEQRRER